MDFDGLEETLSGGWRQFISNGEGPITKNDNAYELCNEMIENGGEFFKVVSKYDDILADVFQRPNYKAGDTLRLVLPFLKAYGATDSSMLEFSRKNLLTMPGARKTMRFVQEFMTPFIVATSYEHYISAVCEVIGFPMENTYCTALDMDSIKMETWEGDLLKRYATEISKMKLMDIPEGAKTVDDFSPQDQESLRRLDEIFWEDLTDLSTYHLILEVNPVGGEEKASAVLDIRRRTGIGLEDTFYIGDSITDAQAFQLVREGGGLTVAFNGNDYALREAEFAIIADNTVVTSVLAEAFHKAGVEGIMTMAEDWNIDGLRSSGLVNEYLLREFERTYPDKLPTVAKITPQNMKTLMRQSASFRRSVRGEAIGALG
jgi:energy-converting hydrogenase A subunit R